MTFSREKADNWHQEVPGARWFKADLHIHTIDDFQGRRARIPVGISGPPESEETIRIYARVFLRRAIERGVQVLGLTPHSPRVATTAETSAVWRIVEEWNQGNDEDGVPFREKLYAVFPGFEPALKQGKSGLHLLFLFDPEIGREHYLKAFDLVMGGVTPWDENNELQLSNKNAEDAFHELRDFHDRECPVDRNGRNRWQYIVLAPHIDSEKGLLEAQKAQVLQLFQHTEIAGLELGDDKLPEDTVVNREWLPEGMEVNHQAFFHASDAYSVEEIGKRHTWIKLASPKIEALRQAFIASDSRVRIGYERDAIGALTEIANPPDVTITQRPWLKTVTVAGRASFFGTTAEDTRATSFQLSPDLTCIIGGSMTGKSTFLDGLRLFTHADLPQDDGIKKQVEARAKERFLAGSAEVTLDCPGQDPTAPDRDRWPAVFYAQNELHRLAQEPSAVEDILTRLVPSEMSSIVKRQNRLNAIDKDLDRQAKHLAQLDDDLSEAEQAFERTVIAANKLEAFSEAGVETLHEASRAIRQWQESCDVSKDLGAHLDRAMGVTDGFNLPKSDGQFVGPVDEAGVGLRSEVLLATWKRIRDHIQSAKAELRDWDEKALSILESLKQHEKRIHTEIDRALAERGLDGSQIKELQALNVQASLKESYEANLDQVRNKLSEAERSFQRLLDERDELVVEQRAAFDRVTEIIFAEFDGRISARREDDGSRGPLDRFLRDLSKRGITRWWNELEDQHRPSPMELLEHLSHDTLNEVGMSAAVQSTFQEQLTRTKQRYLAAIRCSDRYSLELRMDDGRLRRLDDLSGGQRVSLLLSLLLETSDERPLVIDQPEDELDNRFLSDTVLPALKRLKGRRQIIVATHNANIVVNGDADQVIQLDATANRGRVVHSGAIEEPSVRDSIVRTVDGGDDAFRLRRLKYGF